MYLAVDFQGGIENAWSNVATFVPKLAAALLILLVGWFVAKAVASILNKVLEGVGFDRVVERGGVRQVLARSKPAQRDAGRPAACPWGRDRDPGLLAAF